MELICPSCGAKHRTEDYPGAFEILCACGYSILAPDPQAFSTSSDPGFISRAPIADEEDEKASAIPLIAEDDAPLVTPEPDPLPEGMAYDPFELAQSIESSEPSGGFDPPLATPEGAFEEAPADALEPPPATLAPVLAPVGVASTERASPAQVLLDRSQRASLGQLLGHSYRVRCEDLVVDAPAERSRLVAVLERCRKLLKGRPWLEHELRRRRIDLEALPETGGFDDLPEMLAVEFFLACTEAGGRCRFERSEGELEENKTP